MNLNIFNRMDLGNKHSEIIANFMKELSEFISKRNFREDLKMESQLITEFRDKFLIKRVNILNEYANQANEQGLMYYVYGKNDNSYNLSVCEENRSHEVIQVDASKLPYNTNIGSIIREQNGEYTLDIDATNTIFEKIQNIFNELLEEQNAYLNQKRIEGHIYEVSEKGTDRLWLIDKTKGENEEIIEEIDFPEFILDEVEEGSLIEYINGEYRKPE